MDVEANLAQQLALTGQTWAALQHHGVTDGEVRAADAFFVAPGQAQADALVAALQAFGLTAEAHRGRRRLLRRAPWLVRAEDPEVRMGLDPLRAWVREMVRLGAAHDAEFDGWGAQV